jgi:two-component system, chemotaxis family, protein-glutamate methylesterase/glutaminase
LESQPDLKVVGQASNGEQGLKMIQELKPDVVTLDYEMPGWNGLETLTKIMEECPTPVVMLSAYTQKDAQVTIDALEQGAVDFIPKTSKKLPWDLKNVKDEITLKIKNSGLIDITRFQQLRKQKLPKLPLVQKEILEEKIVVIGASTGGPVMVEQIIKQLPKNFPGAVVIAQHMPGTFTPLFAERLNEISELEVREAIEGELVTRGTVYVAPGDFQIKIKNPIDGNKKNGLVLLNDCAPGETMCPSIDILMESVAEVYGKNALGVILTGMGADGAQGLLDIRNAGGRTIAQDEKSSVIFGMAKEAIARGAAQEIIAGQGIAEKLIELITQDS